ncbi:MAG: hypothetical protein ACOZFS_09960 [Thermodesulfobacteriota bacterium]
MNEILSNQNDELRRGGAAAMASTSVTEATDLQPGEDSLKDTAIAGKDDGSGCQQPDSDPHKPGGANPGVTMARLAAMLKLPQTLFEKQGLANCKKNGLPAVRIPHLDPQGNTRAVKWLVNLNGEQASFASGKSDKPALYGLKDLEIYRTVKYVFLVDGIFDCWVCQHHKIAALALPEPLFWRQDWNQYLADLTVYIWDKDAPVLLPKLVSETQDLQIIKMPEGFKNLTEAHLQGKDIYNLVEQNADVAVSAKDYQQKHAHLVIKRHEHEAASVITAADPVQLVREAIQSLGYGGDLKPPLITYLALTSRVLAMRPGTMPVHLLLLGQPSSGKSYCLQLVLKMMPPDTYNKIDAGSPKVFIYDDFDCQHRAVIFSEADSLPAGEDNPAASGIRNLLQDNYLHYKVTERDPETGQFVVREIEKPGPVVFATTAVKRLGTQLDSRLFSLEVPDDLAQIQAALGKQADIELAGMSDPDPALIAYQAYLQALAPWEVIVPFAKRLAESIGRLPNASRITRDFARLMSLIKTVAVMRHGKRQRDEQGRLIAEFEDYALVYELVGQMYETTITRVSDKIRNVIRAVKELRSENISPVSETKVAQRLGCSKQAITRAVKEALKQGWLVNHETKRGYPYDLVEGEPLPGGLGLPPTILLHDPLEYKNKDKQKVIQEPGNSNDAGESPEVTISWEEPF